ncbi:MAG: transporter substrate-binding domain-containing protein [Alphaproteobacteria bacterium]|nr:transporter substrate-binding domain-containing protein [Alphaproteobacteria bacterium]
MLKTILAGAALALALTSVADAQTLDKIKQRGSIVVGVKNDYKPWGFLDPSGKIVGMEIDLAQDVANRLNAKLELIPVVAANRMEFLQQGRIDLIIATLGDTAQRRTVIGMIEPNYYAGGTNVLAPKSAGLKDWKQLKDRKVCAIQGAYYNRRVTQLYGPELVSFTGIPEVLNALQQGNCIAFVFDNTLIDSTLSSGDPKWANYEMPLVTEDEQPWAIAVPLPELNGPYGEFMKKVSIDWHKTGKIVELEKKWGIKPSPFVAEMHQKHKAM